MAAEMVRVVCVWCACDMCRVRGGRAWCVWVSAWRVFGGGGVSAMA